MKRVRLVLAAGLTASLAAASLPARAAELCLQFDGASCALSGDTGFFRFLGAKLPKSPKKAAALHGRACGTGVVTGTAVRNPDDSLINVAATFVCDATAGLISAAIAPATTGVGSTHTGDASFGTFDLPTSCTVTIVDCDGEPGTP
jgi:hypothetical protein